MAPAVEGAPALPDIQIAAGAAAAGRGVEKEAHRTEAAAVVVDAVDAGTPMVLHSTLHLHTLHIMRTSSTPYPVHSSAYRFESTNKFNRYELPGKLSRTWCLAMWRRSLVVGGLLLLLRVEVLLWGSMPCGSLRRP